MNTQLVEPIVADLFLKSSAIFIFTALAFRMWKRASASQRECIWCVTFALAAVLPFTRLVEPLWALSFSKASAPMHATSTENLSELKTIIPVDTISASPIEQWTVQNGAKLGIYIWLTGIFLLLAYRLTGAFLLCRGRSLSSPLHDGEIAKMALSIRRELEITRPVDIRISYACQVPVTWGTYRPVVLLPAKALRWPQEWLESALRHEMGHVKNYDHLKRLGVYLTCAFYWPNPLIWAAAKQLVIAQEESSDNCVLRGGLSPESYVTQLIAIIQSSPDANVLSIPNVAMVGQTALEGRLSAILETTRNRKTANWRMTLTGILFALALGLGSGVVQVRAAEPAPTEPALSGSANPANSLLQKQLKSIVIDSISINKVPFFKVIGILEKKMQDLGPDKQGVKFVLYFKELRLPQDKAKWEINLVAENMPLDKILDSVASQTNSKWSIEDDAVCFRF